MRIGRKVAIWALGLGISAASFAQDATKASAADRIREASAHSLGSLTERPWHLKLDATLFDDKGKNPQPGSIELWSDGDNRRTVMHFSESTSTRLVVGGKVYPASTGPVIPYEAEALLLRVLHPGPTTEEINSSQPEVRKQAFGKTTLDCVMLSQPINRLASAPLGLFPTYCLGPASHTIVISYDFGTEASVVRASSKFLDHSIPMKLELQDAKGITVARAEVESLTSYVPVADEFKPPADVSPTTDTARVAGGVLAGNSLTKVQPVYPASAKANHVSGTVVLKAIIGTDGHVHALRPISAPDPDLAIAAIYAVRQWTYKPYLLNGEPTSVESTITVNFALNY